MPSRQLLGQNSEQIRAEKGPFYDGLLGTQVGRRQGKTAKTIPPKR
jgi:hypothetical protein